MFYGNPKNYINTTIHLLPGSTAFPGSENYHLVAIMQWQYWWWFWFAFAVTIYYAFINRLISNRLTYMNPKIVTSYRSHGRWGDLIICAIPIFWCVNILSNSHFLLRALEWQTETSPILLRVRGKQWYWVYKFDLNNYATIDDIPKIIGRGKKIQFSQNHIDKSELTLRNLEKNKLKTTRQDAAMLKSETLANRSVNYYQNQSICGSTNTSVRYRSANTTTTDLLPVQAMTTKKETFGTHKNSGLCTTVVNGRPIDWFRIMKKYGVVHGINMVETSDVLPTKCVTLPALRHERDLTWAVVQLLTKSITGDQLSNKMVEYFRSRRHYFEPGKNFITPRQLLYYTVGRLRPEGTGPRINYFINTSTKRSIMHDALLALRTNTTIGRKNAADFAIDAILITRSRAIQKSANARPSIAKALPLLMPQIRTYQNIRKSLKGLIQLEKYTIYNKVNTRSILDAATVRDSISKAIFVQKQMYYRRVVTSYIDNIAVRGRLSRMLHSMRESLLATISKEEMLQQDVDWLHNSAKHRAFLKKKFMARVILDKSNKLKVDTSKPMPSQRKSDPEHTSMKKKAGNIYTDQDLFRIAKIIFMQKVANLRYPDGRPPENNEPTLLVKHFLKLNPELVGTDPKKKSTSPANSEDELVTRIKKERTYAYNNFKVEFTKPIMTPKEVTYFHNHQLENVKYASKYSKAFFGRSKIESERRYNEFMFKRWVMQIARRNILTNDVRFISPTKPHIDAIPYHEQWLERARTVYPRVYELEQQQLRFWVNQLIYNSIKRARPKSSTMGIPLFEAITNSKVVVKPDAMMENLKTAVKTKVAICIYNKKLFDRYIGMANKEVSKTRRLAYRAILEGISAQSGNNFRESHGKCLGSVVVDKEDLKELRSRFTKGYNDAIGIIVAGHHRILTNWVSYPMRLAIPQVNDDVRKPAYPWFNNYSSDTRLNRGGSIKSIFGFKQGIGLCGDSHTIPGRPSTTCEHSVIRQKMFLGNLKKFMLDGLGMVIDEKKLPARLEMLYMDRGGDKTIILRDVRAPNNDARRTHIITIKANEDWSRSRTFGESAPESAYLPIVKKRAAIRARSTRHAAEFRTSFIELLSSAPTTKTPMTRCMENSAKCPMDRSMSEQFIHQVRKEISKSIQLKKRDKPRRILSNLISRSIAIEDSKARHSELTREIRDSMREVGCALYRLEKHEELCSSLLQDYISKTTKTAYHMIIDGIWSNNGANLINFYKVCTPRVGMLISSSRKLHRSFIESKAYIDVLSSRTDEGFLGSSLDILRGIPRWNTGVVKNPQTSICATTYKYLKRGEILKLPPWKLTDEEINATLSLVKLPVEPITQSRIKSVNFSGVSKVLSDLKKARPSTRSIHNTLLFERKIVPALANSLILSGMNKSIMSDLLVRGAIKKVVPTDTNFIKNLTQDRNSYIRRLITEEHRGSFALVDKLVGFIQRSFMRKINTKLSVGDYLSGLEHGRKVSIGIDQLTNHVAASFISQKNIKIADAPSTLVNGGLRNYFKTEQIANSDNRFVKNSYDPGYSIKLLGTPTEGDVLSLKTSTNKKIIRNAEANVSIVIKQKKLDKTNFSSKLDQRITNHTTGANNKRAGLFVNEGGVLVPLPDYTSTNDHNYANKTRNYGSGDNILNINKSYPNQKRLLWVNKQVIVPIQVSITVITNSYDVIHSWFVPGLGLKMDCVPGRSTHHTIYIEHAGYYYGQCAEVCGRRHHHMPIKLFAVPFVYFSYWWKQTIKEGLLKN